MGTTNNRTRTAYEEHRIIRRLAEDPPEGELEGGEKWFNTTTNEYRGYNGTDYVTFDVTPDA